MTTLHPLLAQRGFTCVTPPLREFSAEFTRRVRIGESSMLCIGTPRFGKTTASKFVQDSVGKTKKMVPLYAMLDGPAKGRTPPLNAFWRRFRVADEDAYTYEMNQNPYRVIINRTRILAEEYETERVLIGMDEAQNATEDWWGSLKTFTEELIDLKLSPFVLSTAQPRILLNVERLKAKSLDDIVDRFLTGQMWFRGLRFREFPTLMRHIDTARWPEATGPTYTEHWVPGLFKAGWRLEQQAPAIAGAFRSRFKGLSEDGAVGTKFAVVASRLLLTTLHDNERLWAKEGPSLIDQCVRECGYSETRQVIGDAERNVRSKLAALAHD